MKPMLLIPLLAVALVTLSATFTAAMACVPGGPGMLRRRSAYGERQLLPYRALLRGMPEKRRDLERQKLPEAGRYLQGEGLAVGRQELQAAGSEHGPEVTCPRSQAPNLHLPLR